MIAFQNWLEENKLINKIGNNGFKKDKDKQCWINVYKIIKILRDL